MKQLDRKYDKIAMIVGSDRVEEFQKLLHVYNGRDYDFDHIDIISAGDQEVSEFFGIAISMDGNRALIETLS